MDTLRKRIRYLLARNGSLEMDCCLSPLIDSVDDIPDAILNQVASFLEQEEVCLFSQLRGLEEPPSEIASGARWIFQRCSVKSK